MSDTAIEIGIFATDYSAGAAGLNAVTGTDANAEADSAGRANTAVVDYINATGGIAGRTVKPVTFWYNARNFFTPSGRQQEHQAACATWTEDHHVFAFSAYGLTEELMLDCAARSETPMVAVGPGPPPPSQRRFEEMTNYWYGTHHFVADRRERAIGRFLLERGFFGKNAKVALMIEDKVGIREGVDRGLKPVLADAGIEPKVEVVYPDFIQSPWPNYVLQMQQAGVTHVVWSSTTAWSISPLLMMRAAENQGFRPRWGLGSGNSPGTSAPPEQMANMVGMGWLPGADVGDTTPTSPNAVACAKVLKEAGLEENDAHGTGLCEVLFFLRAAFEHAEEVSSAGLAGGVARLADTYASLWTIDGATHFAQGRHDGPAVVRPFVYDRECECMTYRDAAQPIPG